MEASSCIVQNILRFLGFKKNDFDIFTCQEVKYDYVFLDRNDGDRNNCCAKCVGPKCITLHLLLFQYLRFANRTKGKM